MVSARNAKATLALTNSYPREEESHRLLLKEPAIYEDIRPAQLEEAPPKIDARAHTSRRNL